MKVKKLASLKGHEASIYALSEGIESGTLFSAGGDKTITEWNLQDFVPQLFAVRLTAAIYSLAASKKKRILAAGNAAGELHIIDKYKIEEISLLKLSMEGIFEILFVDELNLMFVTSADGYLHIVSSDTYNIIEQLKISDSKIRQLIYDNVNEQLFAACTNGSVYTVGLKSKKVGIIIKLENDSVNCIYMDHVNCRLLVGTKNARLQSYSLGNFELQQDIPAHNYALYSIVGHSNGKWIATGSRDKTIKVWNLADLSVLVRIDAEKYDGHVNSVNKLVWSAYKDQLLSASDDRSIMAWEITE